MWAREVIRKAVFVAQLHPMCSCTNDCNLPSAAQEPFKHHSVDATPVLLMEMTTEEDVVVGKEIRANMILFVSNRFQYAFEEMVH